VSPTLYMLGPDHFGSSAVISALPLMLTGTNLHKALEPQPHKPRTPSGDPVRLRPRDVYAILARTGTDAILTSPLKKLFSSRSLSSLKS
jgi:hypothetical protein